MEVSYNFRRSERELSKFNGDYIKHMREMERATRKLDHGMARFVQTVGFAKKREKELSGLRNKYEGLIKASREYADTEAHLAAMLKLVKQAKPGAERKQAMANYHKRKEELGVGDVKQRMAAKNQMKEQIDEWKRTLEDAADEDPFGVEELVDNARAAGEAMVQPLHDLAARDLPGLVSSSFKLAMGSGQMAKMLAKNFAGGYQQAREQGHGMAGAAMQGLGKSMEGFLGVFKQLGPMLQIVGAGVASFVKIMIDAEAGAKEFNKQLLSTAGTSEFLHRRMGDVTAATDDLDKSLRAARGGATAWSNVLWGISKEMGGSFLNSLHAEGVSMVQLGEAMKTTTGYADEHSKVIQMGVAYSRAFGVSLSEIGQLQGQMMADIGMGLDGVQENFQRMADAADTAGIATNKFFSIISSFSSDLTLFALRMEDVTKVMGQLGKTMDPREAQKFLHDLTQKFTGGLTENLQATLIGGAGMRKVVERDLAGKKAKVREDVAGALGPGNEEALKKLDELLGKNSSPKEIAKWQAEYAGKIDVQQRKAIVSAIYDASNMTNRVLSGDAVDLASILDQLNPLSKIAALEEQAQSVFHKGLDQLSGAELIAAENALHMSHMELREYRKLGGAVLATQEELFGRIEKGQMTDEDRAQLKRLNVSDADMNRSPAELLKVVKKQLANDEHHQKFWASLDKSQQELLAGSNAEIDYQRQTAGFQTSMLDRMQMIYDALMNQLYDIMTDIWEYVSKIVSVFFRSDAQKEYDQARLAAMRSKDAGVRKAFSDNPSDLAKARAQIVANSGQQMQRQIQSAVAEYKDIVEQLKDEKLSKADRAALEARKKELEPAQAYAGFTADSLNKAVGKEGSLAKFLTVPQIIKRLEALKRVSGAADTEYERKRDEAKKETKPGATAGGTREETRRAQAVTSNTAATAEASKAVQQAVTKGVPLDETQLRGAFSTSMAKSVYEGTARALFEYYMYSGLNRADVAGAMGKGVSPSALAQGMVNAKGEAPETVLGRLLKEAEDGGARPNAAGGTVTSIIGRLAQVKRFPQPPAGEGWASVGPGERILPAGRGGGGGGGGVRVQLELKGDLKRFIDARVVDGAAAHDRNRRHR